MPIIQLPDGSTKQYDAAVTPATVASDIGPGLAKAAMAARVDGQDWDLARAIETDCALELLTAKDSAAALELVRHDCAHIMAEAVLELYPGTQVTMALLSKMAFIMVHREQPFSTEDLDAIEQRMHEIVDRDEPIIRGVWTRDEAVAF